MCTENQAYALRLYIVVVFLVLGSPNDVAAETWASETPCAKFLTELRKEKTLPDLENRWWFVIENWLWNPLSPDNGLKSERLGADAELVFLKRRSKLHGPTCNANTQRILIYTPATLLTVGVVARPLARVRLDGSDHLYVVTEDGLRGFVREQDTETLDPGKVYFFAGDRSERIRGCRTLNCEEPFKQLLDPRYYFATSNVRDYDKANAESKSGTSQCGPYKVERFEVLYDPDAGVRRAPKQPGTLTPCSKDDRRDAWIRNDAIKVVDPRARSLSSPPPVTAGAYFVGPTVAQRLASRNYQRFAQFVCRDERLEGDAKVPAAHSATGTLHADFKEHNVRLTTEPLRGLPKLDRIRLSEHRMYRGFTLMRENSDEQVGRVKIESVAECPSTADDRGAEPVMPKKINVWVSMVGGDDAPFPDIEVTPCEVTDLIDSETKKDYNCQKTLYWNAKGSELADGQFWYGKGAGDVAFWRTLMRRLAEEKLEGMVDEDSVWQARLLSAILMSAVLVTEK